jgi:hypothetical protein
MKTQGLNQTYCHGLTRIILEDRFMRVWNPGLMENVNGASKDPSTWTGSFSRPPPSESVRFALKPKVFVWRSNQTTPYPSHPTSRLASAGTQKSPQVYSSRKRYSGKCYLSRFLTYQNDNVNAWSAKKLAFLEDCKQTCLKFAGRYLRGLPSCQSLEIFIFVRISTGLVPTLKGRLVKMSED